MSPEIINNVSEKWAFLTGILRLLGQQHDQMTMILGENDDPVEDLSSGLSELQKQNQAYIDDIDWEKDFLAQIGPTMSKQQCQESDEEEEEDSPVVEPKLKSLSGTLTALKRCI